MIFANSSYNIA